MAQPYLGQIIAVGFNFAPIGWVLCQGQLLQIAENDALFNLIGTTYGGDGQTTFAVPNLCGRAGLSVGQGPRTSNYALGQIAGSENVTVAASQVAAHSHTLLASSKTGTSATPGPTLALAVNSNTAASLYTTPPTSVALAGTAISQTGSGGPHENRQPFLTINYIMAVNGIYPSQN